MAKKKRLLARPIDRPSDIHYQIARLTIRPSRVSYLIDTRVSLTDLFSYLKYNSSIWGGYANFFAPVKDGIIEKDWWNEILTFDPDMVIICGPESDELYHQVVEEIQPFRITYWSGSEGSRHDLGIDRHKNVPMRFVISHWYKQNRPIESSRFTIPKYLENAESLLDLCAIAQLGVLEPDAVSFYEDVLAAKSVEIRTSDIHSYLELLEVFRGRVYPIKVTKMGLASKGEFLSGFMLGVTIILITEESCVEDLCLFWNLRAGKDTPISGVHEILLLPLEHLSHVEEVSNLGKWINRYQEDTNLITLVSSGINRTDLEYFRDRIKTCINENFLVDIWHAHFRIPDINCYHRTVSREVRIEGDKIEIPLPFPDWYDQISAGVEWVIDIDLSSSFGSMNSSGYIPQKFRGISQTLAGHPDLSFFKDPLPFYQLRLARSMLSLRARSDLAFQTITLPNDDTLISDLLSSKNYDSRVTDKCNYARGMIKLLRNEDRLLLVRDRGLRHVFKMMKPMTGYSVGQIKQYIGSLDSNTEYRDAKKLDDLIADLTARGILIRGYMIRCPKCDLNRWYTLNEFEEIMQCGGCLSDFQPPIQSIFRYRLNELFVQGISQGALPLILVDDLLKRTCRKSYLRVPGLEIGSKGNLVDLDLLGICDGFLVLVEAKDLSAGQSSRSISDIIKQLEKNLIVAQEIGVEIFILATMIAELSLKLNIAIDRFRVRFPKIGIHVALLADLERGKLQYEAAEGNYRDCSIINLLSVSTIDKGKGRILEPGTRKIATGGGIKSQTI